MTTDPVMEQPKEITLTAERYASQWLEAGAFARDRLEYSRQDSPPGFDGVLHQLSTQILTREIAKDSYPVTFSYEYPANWWEMLKKDKAPKWFNSRYPVKYQKKAVKRMVYITRKATYPMADIVMPKNMGTIVIKDVVSPLTFYEESDHDTA